MIDATIDFEATQPADTESVADPSGYEFMRPIVTKWEEKIALALKHRGERFDPVAQQGMAFFGGSMGWMWDDKYRAKFLGANINPRFKITLNKAFELVAVFGPVLYSRNPVRTCRPYSQMELGPDKIAASMGIDWQQVQEMQAQLQQAMESGQQIPPEVMPQVQQMQEIQQQIEGLLSADRMSQLQRQALSEVLEHYLSYTPREQPAGGLKTAAEDAITEALIKGRGILWPMPYRMPGSNRLLTGCFYDSVDNFLVDPDAHSVEFGDAKWIARKVVKPHWEWEREYSLRPGSLRKAAKMESIDGQSARKADDLGNLHKSQGTTHDLVTGWKIWSIGGVGTRLSGCSQVMHEAFDDVVGDYAHLVIVKGIPWPLNAPSHFMKEATDDEVRDAFAWPVPTWTDKRWPCAILDFYRKPNSPYPISPLAPAMGELTALNVIISTLVERVWESNKQIVATLQSAKAQVDKALRSNSQRHVIALHDIHGDINKVISEFKAKDISKDAWHIVDRLFDLFDRRVGLADLLYGMDPRGGVSRTAKDISVKEEKLNVRPDHMAKKVEAWLSDAATLEKLTAFWGDDQGPVTGEDINPLLGTAGSQIWDRLFVEADPEVITREMVCTVEAGSAKKPNKDKDLANITAIYAAMSAQFDKQADATGDTEQLNALNKMWLKALDQDDPGLMMKPRVPPQQEGPSPEEIPVSYTHLRAHET